MEKTIKYPKVFISYAWNEEEYQEKVIAFATDLKSNGIQVILDRWQLTEGNDIYDFMERSVKDTSVTNVLILLDPTYAKKADDREGGVGTEASIISSKVYKEVGQTKFLPVVFGRDEQGAVCKPTFLENRLHFDLTNDDTYTNEYQRLVRTLYGVKTIPEPPLGNPPDWIENVSPISAGLHVKYERLRNNVANSLSNDTDLQDYLFQISDEILMFGNDIVIGEYTPKNFAIMYEKTKDLRSKLLSLLKNSSYVKEGYKYVIDSLENVRLGVEDIKNIKCDVLKVFLHEIFIYLVAYFVKYRNQEALKYIFTKSYRNPYTTSLSNFNIFYSNHEYLDIYMNQRDDKRYHSGTATYWIDNLVIEATSMKEFSLADILCFNASLFTENNARSSIWPPVTYLYARDTFERNCIRLQSREYLEYISYIFGFSSIEKFKDKYKHLEEKISKGDLRSYGHPTAYELAPCFMYYVKSDELGICN